MFKLSKHNKEICLAFHFGYDLEYKQTLIVLDFYKYELTVHLGVNYV